MGFILGRLLLPITMDLFGCLHNLLSRSSWCSLSLFGYLHRLICRLAGAAAAGGGMRGEEVAAPEEEKRIKEFNPKLHR